MICVLEPQSKTRTKSFQALSSDSRNPAKRKQSTPRTPQNPMSAAVHSCRPVKFDVQERDLLFLLISHHRAGRDHAWVTGCMRHHASSYLTTWRCGALPLAFINGNVREAGIGGMVYGTSHLLTCVGYRIHITLAIRTKDVIPTARDVRYAVCYKTAIFITESNSYHIWRFFM